MSPRVSNRPVRSLLLLLLLWTAIVGVAASPAHASTPRPGWVVWSAAAPTVFSPARPESCSPPFGGIPACDGYFVTATNVGSAASSGLIVITDSLPAGTVVLRVQGHSAKAYEPGSGSGEGEEVGCSVSGRAVTCVYGGSVAPGGIITFHVLVEVLTGLGSTLPANRVGVSEVGGASAVGEDVSATPVSLASVGFGVTQFSVGAFDPAGERDVLAGAHPGGLLTSIAFNTVLEPRIPPGSEPLMYAPVAEPKLTNVDLPMGFVGDALAAPRCSAAALAASACPANTIVGDIGIFNPEGKNDELPYLYNITPEPGYPAQFGFNIYETVVMLRARVLPSVGGYVLSVPVPTVPRSELKKPHEVSVFFFGEPTFRDTEVAGESFASNPVDCAAGALSARLEMNAWVEPSNWQSAEAPMYAGSGAEGVTNCGALEFAPSISVEPETTTVDTPSGFEIAMRVPQTANIEGNLATSDLKDATVTFPSGVSLSPSAANGLVACQASGPEGIELGNHDQVDADRLASEGIIQEGEERGYRGNEDGLVHAAAGHCPLASQVGEVEVHTPLLEEPLKGHLYVAEPGCGGAGQRACTSTSAEDGELFGVYLEVAGSGVVIKLHGQVSVNPQTGQLSTRFTEAPELPFSELTLKLNGGQRAPLANPQSCGGVTVTSDLTPWSTPYTPDATPSSGYVVGGCTGTFAPGFSAGMSDTLQAGAFSPFTLTLSRHDGEGDFSGLTVNMPEGLLGRIAGVPLCGEAAANAGSCPEASRIGSALAAAGAGSDPFWQRGNVYLTGPYNGGPFGLSVVVPAVAGPYDLGNIVVRASIRVNPVTAAVSVVSDSLPQMVDGVPLRVQTINVAVGEGDGFTFNPTNCTRSVVSGTVSSTAGASVGVSAPFAAAGCRGLSFKPVLTAATAGKASKAKGASLDTKLSMPPAAKGSGMASAGANIASVKVELPKQLPARNTTLQKACLAAVFNANPASCPAASDVGSVVLHTPLLASPLVGPAYLVSYGGEKFPQMVMILQGEGVRLEVTGYIYVSKQGITSVTVRSVPDASFTSFELKTPIGPYSVLTSYVPARDEFNLCGQSLVMPTEIAGQNGLVFKQKTKVAITGCAKSKNKAKRAKNARRYGGARSAASRKRGA